QFVVANDIELNKEIFLCRLDPFEDRVEGRRAVDEQFDIVAVQEWQLGNLRLDRPFIRGFPVDQREILGAQRSVRASVLDPVGSIVVKKLPPEDHVKKNGGEGQQRQR